MIDVARESTPARTGPAALPRGPVSVRGKFLFVRDEKLYLRGITYGPFRLGEHGEYGSPECVGRDFAMMANAGANAVRLYSVPPVWLVDRAAVAGLRVIVGVPWAQHLPFLDDRGLVRDATERCRNAARALRGHPARLAFAVGNEIPPGVVRWYGPRRIESVLRQLCGTIRDEDPDALVTYVNYPPTEYLHLPFIDFHSFNVFLEDRARLARYLSRLQNIAGDRPLVMTEMGLDSLRHGLQGQAASVDWQLRTAFAAGCAGAFVFSWTAEWPRGGGDIPDWAFGIPDAQRRPKPALAAASAAFADVPCTRAEELPSASVVVCSYNGSRTIRRCLEALQRLDYPGCEVIVVDDGSEDQTAAIAAEFPVRLIRTENRGLSAARNTGWQEARGEIVAYVDDDAYPDPHWLQYLAQTLLENHAGAGGPNLPVPGDGLVAACVTHVPGNPTHVLLSDTIAEHVPGCNMAFWRWALQEVGGFDTQFRIAGDDVDLCWRLQDLGQTLGFSPGAVVWHHRRGQVRRFWRQQVNYGRAEADLERKWPHKYNPIGHATWAGRLYGQGAGASNRDRRRIYHGVWGSAMFQHVYPVSRGLLWSLPAMPEWYGAMGLVAATVLLGLVWAPLLLFAPLLVAMVAFAASQAILHASRADLRDEPRTWRRRLTMRGVIALMYLLQPIARLRGRIHAGLTPWRLRGVSGFAAPWSCRPECWRKRWREPGALLAAMEDRLRAGGAVVMRGDGFARWDLELRTGLVGRVRLRHLTADLEHGAQYVRVEATPRFAPAAVMLFMLLIVLCGAATSEQVYVLAFAAWAGAFATAALGVRELAAAMATVRSAFTAVSEE